MAKSTLPDLTLREEARTARKEVNKNPDLKAVFEKIDEKNRSLSRSDILGRYEIGREVARVADDENKFGSGAIRLLAAAMLLNESDLYKWKAMTVAWSPDEIKVLAEKRTCHNQPLYVNHLAAIANVPKESLRKKLLSRCLKEGLTFRDLSGIIQEKLGIRSNNPKGRKAKVRSPISGATELDKLGDKWLDVAENFDECVCEPLDKKPGEYATQELAERLVELKKTVSEIVETAESSLKKIESAHEKVVNELQAQEQVRATEAAEKKANKKKKLKLKLKKKKKLKLKKKKLKLKKGGSKTEAIKKAKAAVESNGDDDVDSDE